MTISELKNRLETILLSCPPDTEVVIQVSGNQADKISISLEYEDERDKVIIKEV